MRRTQHAHSAAIEAASSVNVELQAIVSMLNGRRTASIDPYISDAYVRLPSGEVPWCRRPDAQNQTGMRRI